MERRSFILGIVAGISLAMLPSFMDHFIWFITGQVNQIVVRQRWDLVALNIIGFLAFLLPLTYRKKADWQSYGIYAAFIVSLFIEMYGIPLSIYFTSAFVSGVPEAAGQEFILEFAVLGQQLGMTFWMLVGAGITAAGMGIVLLGWFQLYTADSELVTSGIYAYSRHPQYVGISLIALGWFIGWPTLLTMLMLPLLIYSYYNAAQREEEDVIDDLDDPEAYQDYRERVPMFL